MEKFGWLNLSRSSSHSCYIFINYWFYNKLLSHFVVAFYYFCNANWETANEGHIDFGDNLILVTIFERCWRYFNIVVIFSNFQIYIRSICDSSKDSLLKTWMMILHFGSFKRSLLRSLLFSYLSTVRFLFNFGSISWRVCWVFAGHQSCSNISMWLWLNIAYVI